MLSVVIPSRNEQFLRKTIEDLLIKAEGEVEVIVILDDFQPTETALLKDPRVRYIPFDTPVGLRHGMNVGVDAAKGEFIMKSDGHCMFDEGFDVKLAADCQKNWIVVPRRKRLDAENWCVQDVGKVDVDYEHISFPDNPSDFGGAGLHTRQWNKRTVERLNKPEYMIDDDMTYQASVWFIPKKYYYELELMDEKRYGIFFNEAQEEVLKCWLSGGRVVVNKNTWFAHLKKGKKYPRGYFINNQDLTRGTEAIMEWTTNSAWDKQTLPFSWLIEKFWPVPGWPENWRELLWGKKGEPWK
ncbi:hypothetical protein COU91_02705 [Candidatus Saccharibacteria bacterium CG10_big_fil_rev_8_21_14_0_10_47_8]|nr:MAG: hypothetical protein COU91_02705 [Candidatus Saccharibacteria bacterium CG10_big_fil_rev_8_21_14_0_10_47_8]